VQSWLSWNSLCKPGWPRTQKSACLCLCLPGARIKGVRHHCRASRARTFFKKYFVCVHVAVCMFVCVHVAGCTFVCVHVAGCMCVCACCSVHVCVCACCRVHVCVCMLHCACLCVCMFLCACCSVQVCVSACFCVHVAVCRFVCLHVSVCMLQCAGLCVCMFLCACCSVQVCVCLHVGITSHGVISSNSIHFCVCFIISFFSSLTLAILTIRRAWVAYLSVLSVSSMLLAAGLTVAIMAVFEFPPRLSFNSL
jgi:hypothetical protein